MQRNTFHDSFSVVESLRCFNVSPVNNANAAKQSASCVAILGVITQLQNPTVQVSGCVPFVFEQRFPGEHAVGSACAHATNTI